MRAVSAAVIITAVQVNSGDEILDGSYKTRISLDRQTAVRNLGENE
jgi:hypothetical protein